jgi:hypothetical protein
VGPHEGPTAGHNHLSAPISALITLGDLFVPGIQSYSGDVPERSPIPKGAIGEDHVAEPRWAGRMTGHEPSSVSSCPQGRIPRPAVATWCPDRDDASERGGSPRSGSPEAVRHGPCRTAVVRKSARSVEGYDRRIINHNRAGAFVDPPPLCDVVLPVTYTPASLSDPWL